jgi:hypothetical protein
MPPESGVAENSTRLELGVISFGAIVALALLSPPLGIYALLAASGAIAVFGVRRERYLVAVLAVAFCLKVLVILVNHRYGVLPPPNAYGHFNNLDRIAAVAGQWPSGIQSALEQYDGKRLINIFPALPFYLLLGKTEAAAQIGVAFYSTGIGILSYSIARHVTTRRRSIFATALVMFWPSIFYRTILLQRETYVVIFMLTGVLIGLRWIYRIRTIEVILLGVVFWALFHTRQQNILIVTLTVAAGVAFGHRNGRYLQSLAGIVAISTTALLVRNSRAFLKVFEVTPEAIYRFGFSRARGDARYLEWLQYETWFDVVLYLPLKTGYFLFGPLPWHITGFARLFAGMSGWALVFMALYSLRSFLRRTDRTEDLFVLGVYLVVGVSAFAIIEFNFGSVFRHRVQFVPVVLVIAAGSLPVVTFESGLPTRPSHLGRT